jgi:hypothetical protein
MMPRRFLVVVRRDRDEVFRVFQQYYAESQYAVVWDRRSTERRQGHQRVTHERRQAERRGPLPSSWESLGYLLARPPMVVPPG